MLRSREREEIIGYLQGVTAKPPGIILHEQINTTDEGAALVRNLEAFLTRYVILPERTALPLGLWALLSYTFQSFDAVPYLIINSPAPRCGKTRLLECLELIVSNPRRASNISEAALFRTIEKFAPTVLLDEAETLIGKSERAEYLRQILNAGNRRGATVTRCTGQGTNMDAVDFSVFCPKVLAGIGHFPQTITDRAIVVSMQRRKDSETVARFLYKRAEPEGEALRERAALFIGGRKEEIEAAYGKVELDFISDRDAEAWSPLFALLAIADVSRLGELRDSAVRLTQIKTSNAEDDNLSLRLLADLRVIWPETERHALTGDLITRLKAIEESPWAAEMELNPRKLARMLRGFGVSPSTVRADGRNGKGYCREDARAAFARYLPPETSHASQPA